MAEIQLVSVLRRRFPSSSPTSDFCIQTSVYNASTSAPIIVSIPIPIPKYVVQSVPACGRAGWVGAGVMTRATFEVEVGVGLGHRQFDWLVQDGFLQKPLEQVMLLGQLLLDTQVSLQLGTGEGEGDGLGVGVAVAQTQFDADVQDGFLQKPPEHVRFDGQSLVVVHESLQLGTGEADGEGVGVGLGDGEGDAVGVGVALAHKQLVELVQDGFLQLPVEPEEMLQVIPLGQSVVSEHTLLHSGTGEGEGLGEGVIDPIVKVRLQLITS